VALPAHELGRGLAVDHSLGQPLAEKDVHAEWLAGLVDGDVDGGLEGDGAVDAEVDLGLLAR